MDARTVPTLSDLHIRLVSKCNLNCKHCYASDWFVRSDRLDATLVTRAIDEAMDLGLETVTFSGGEPTLHTEVAALLRHCVGRRVRAKLETNGLLLRRNGNELRNLIVDNKEWLYLYISYDLAKLRGVTDEEHDLIREIVIDLHEHGVDVRLQSSLTQINIGDLDNLVELSREYGISQRIFFDHSVLGNGVSLESFDLDTVLQTLSYLHSLHLNLDFE